MALPEAPWLLSGGVEFRASLTAATWVVGGASAFLWGAALAGGHLYSPISGRAGHLDDSMLLHSDRGACTHMQPHLQHMGNVSNTEGSEGGVWAGLVGSLQTQASAAAHYTWGGSQLLNGVSTVC